jgi:methionyl aminopeptidase
MISIKSKSEIDKMKIAGRIVAAVLERLGERLRPGMKTLELDILAEAIIRDEGAVPSFKGYKTSPGGAAYPASICTSINDEVVHGIPGDIILKEGDIISIDVGAKKDGFHADAARTFAVGTIDPEAQRLIKTAQDSFFKGIRMAVEGRRLGDISSEIQNTVENAGFSVVRALVGHGIGAELHEDPQIPNFSTRSRGVRLSKGMTLAVEPMINYGEYGVITDENLWTVKTMDGSLSAHYENTILITEGEPVILTF